MFTLPDGSDPGLMQKPEITRSRVSKKKKREVFKRDGHRCVWCKSKYWLTVDHIVPRSAGGTNELVNLQTLCKSCNEKKADRLPEGVHELVSPRLPRV